MTPTCTSPPGREIGASLPARVRGESLNPEAGNRRKAGGTAPAPKATVERRKGARLRRPFSKTGGWYATPWAASVGCSSRMVDIDVPLDIAQYAEGQRFVAFFPLNAVPDNDKGVQKQVPQYLCVLTEPHDGLPFDYDQVRVFTWNTRKHRYETAYREHGLNGVLPVTVTKEAFRQGRARFPSLSCG